MTSEEGEEEGEEGRAFEVLGLGFEAAAPQACLVQLPIYTASLKLQPQATSTLLARPSTLEPSKLD